MSPPSHHPPPPQQPPLQPPQYQFYPYPYPHPRPKPSSKPFTSCILATTFLLFIAIAAAIICFVLFRPQTPTISNITITFPSYTLHNNTTVTFTFLQYAAVHNPNRFAFSHHGSSLQLISSSSGPLWFMYIPAGQIAGGHTQYVSAKFDVSGALEGPGPTMELETKMVLVGSVKVLEVFAHHVQKSVRCRVSVTATDGSLLGYSC